MKELRINCQTGETEVVEVEDTRPPVTVPQPAPGIADDLDVMLTGIAADREDAAGTPNMATLARVVRAMLDREEQRTQAISDLASRMGL